MKTVVSILQKLGIGFQILMNGIAVDLPVLFVKLLFFRVISDRLSLDQKTGFRNILLITAPGSIHINRFHQILILLRHGLLDHTVRDKHGCQPLVAVRGHGRHDVDGPPFGNKGYIGKHCCQIQSH